MNTNPQYYYNKFQPWIADSCVILDEPIQLTASVILRHLESAL